MSNAEVDAAFSVLPRQLRDRIDSAFDAAVEQSIEPNESPFKKPKLRHIPAATALDTEGGFMAGGFLPSASTSTSNDFGGGGFIVDEEEAQPGGFVVDTGHDAVTEDEQDKDAVEQAHTRIPLSLIPTALQMLDLQPDDEDVLAVFRNAAQGWDTSGRSASIPSGELFVQRRDWHAVCAALLEPVDDQKEDEDEDVEMGDASRQPAEGSSSDSGDEYQEAGDSESPGYDEDAGDSDDDYQESSRTTGKGKHNGKQKASTTLEGRTRSRKRSVDSDGGDDEDAGEAVQRISPRQKKECRRMYALFFPDVEDKDLDSRRLMIKDITRVAKVLKEKITAEEVC